MEEVKQEQPKELMDQWKTDGLCYKCRRKKYCKTTCRASREAAAARVRAAIMKATGMDKAMAVIKELRGD